jgi:hypothetical protein
MSTTKRIPDQYTIISPTVIIDGDLIVTGNSQSIVTNNTSVTDHIITLNNGLSPGYGPNPLGANIIVDRGISANASLAWNETVKAWQIFNGTTVANITTAASAGLSNVYADSSPTLSSNLNITGHSLFDTANTVTFYTGTISSGKSGLFVDNANGSQQELVTKSAAVAYSIIFG